VCPTQHSRNHYPSESPNLHAGRRGTADRGFLYDWLATGKDRFLKDPWAELKRLKPLVREGNVSAKLHPMEIHVELIKGWAAGRPEVIETVRGFAGMILRNPFHPKDVAFAQALMNAVRELLPERKTTPTSPAKKPVQGTLFDDLPS
jgi:hypothetical protein